MPTSSIEVLLSSGSYEYVNMTSYFYVPHNHLYELQFSLLITVSVRSISLLRSVYAIPMEYNDNKNRR